MEMIISDYLKCKICNQEFLNARDRNRHIKEIHKLEIIQYVIIQYLDGKWPKCQCGCGTKIKPSFFKNKISSCDYTSNHFPRKNHSEETKKKIKENTKKALLEKYGVENIYLSKILKRKTIEKIKKTKKERYGNENYNNLKEHQKTLLKKYGVSNPRYLVKNTKTSKTEKEICQILNGESKFIFQNKEFDIKKGNNIFEIDGDFWHPSVLTELTISQLNSLINDKMKMELINNSDFNLFKIHISDIPEEVTEKSLIINSYTPDYSLVYKQKIMLKSYFKKYIQNKGKSKLKRYVPLLLKFIRTFHPEFPYPDQEENLQEVISKIRNYDLSKILKSEKTLNGNCSVLGNNYLKSNFKSYWNSAFNGNPTPVEAWDNDEIMKKVIEYRIGLNNSGEFFDFSLHQLIRGLSARRITVSFFKPILAAGIYKKILGDVKNPTVLDPCAGFGARLLAFKSLYPEGKYIGIEPNPDTYNELIKLKDELNLSGIKLINKKFEDVDLSEIKYDIAFTSIPYFNKEIYSQPQEYLDKKEWEEKFFRKILSLKNGFIVIPEEYYIEFNLSNQVLFEIQNNSSHLSGLSDKKELIIIL